jgi:hypothetical protein
VINFEQLSQESVVAIKILVLGKIHKFSISGLKEEEKKILYLIYEVAAIYSNPILFVAKIPLLFREQGTGNRE